jgi:hypothetical protein
MMWVLTSMTMLVLVVIAVMIKDLAKVPAVARPAALSVREPATAAGSPRPRRVVPSASRSASPAVSASPSGSAQGPQVTDSSSGLSYPLLSTPWRPGCPYALDTPMFSWSAGESAIAGPAFVAGSATDWYGNACSGLLQQQFQYSSVADLEPTATSLADALDLAYYSGLPHYLTVEGSSGMQVSGHQAWVVTFLLTYPAASSEGLAWTSEAGAVVLVDRGAGQAPAVFYASVPSNLGTSAVGILISSLRLG